MNEVQTMAKAGENVGSAVGTALMTARQGAMAAGKNGAAASRRLARQTARQSRRTLAEHGIDRAQLKELQNAFAESLWRARHELASKIEPPPVGRRRIPRLRLLMAIAMIGAIAGAIASVIFKRPAQLQETGYDRSPDRADRPEDGATTRQFEPRQAQPVRPAQPAVARQSTAGDVNGSPAT